MMKKSMMLISGALAVLAFAALPAIATAGEFTADCEGAPATCSATIAGGVATLTNTSNEKIECTTSEGTATQTNASSTGSVSLIFRGCKEKVSGLNFACNSPEAANGVIKTGALQSHLIYIDPNASTPGVLLTGVNVTFSCASFFKKTVTGDIIGHWTTPQCKSFAEKHEVTFEQSSAGHQKYTQVTTTGPATFDLESNNDNGGPYLTSSQTGTGVLTGAVKSKFTC